MNNFDDVQIEESDGFDFAEYELFEEEENNDRTFNSYLNSNTDY